MVTLKTFSETIVCAHFVASSRDGSGPKMRFAFPDPEAAGCYYVFRISAGGGTNTVGGLNICGGGTLALAETVVNKGSIGGFGLNLWSFSTVRGYTVTASQ